MSELVIHTDGGSRGNPGPAATGIVVLSAGEVIHEAGTYLGVQTNNEAEYTAVLEATLLLPTIIQTYNVTQVLWKLDSMLVIQQLNKVWKIKEPRMAQFAQAIWKNLKALSVQSTFSYVPRAENARADAVVNSVLDAQIRS